MKTKVALAKRFTFNKARWCGLVCWELLQYWRSKNGNEEDRQIETWTAIIGDLVKVCVCVGGGGGEEMVSEVQERREW